MFHVASRVGCFRSAMIRLPVQRVIAAHSAEILPHLSPRDILLSRRKAGSGAVAAFFAWPGASAQHVAELLLTDFQLPSDSAATRTRTLTAADAALCHSSPDLAAALAHASTAPTRWSGGGLHLSDSIHSHFCRPGAPCAVVIDLDGKIDGSTRTAADEAGEAAVAVVLAKVLDGLSGMLGDGFRPRHVAVLRADGAAKASYHLHVDLGATAFSDYTVLGAFINGCVTRSLQRHVDAVNAATSNHQEAPHVAAYNAAVRDAARLVDASIYRTLGSLRVAGSPSLMGDRVLRAINTETLKAKSPLRRVLTAAASGSRPTSFSDPAWLFGAGHVPTTDVVLESMRPVQVLAASLGAWETTAPGGLALITKRDLPAEAVAPQRRHEITAQGRRKGPFFTVAECDSKPWLAVQTAHELLAATECGEALRPYLQWVRAGIALRRIALHPAVQEHMRRAGRQLDEEMLELWDSSSREAPNWRSGACSSKWPKLRLRSGDMTTRHIYGDLRFLQKLMDDHPRSPS